MAQAEIKNDLIQQLSGRAEKLISDNLHQDEKILVKLQGHFGQALVITDQRIYIAKWGFMTGNTIGGRCAAFNFKNITGLEIKKNWTTGTLEILTPSMQNTQKSYWGKGDNDALRSDNVITFESGRFDLFQKATNTGRELIDKAHNQDSKNPDSNGINDLEKLADLHNKGIITKEEFEAKKKQILGI